MSEQVSHFSFNDLEEDVYFCVVPSSLTVTTSWALLRRRLSGITSFLELYLLGGNSLSSSNVSIVPLLPLALKQYFYHCRPCPYGFTAGKSRNMRHIRSWGQQLLRDSLGGFTNVLEICDMGPSRFSNDVFVRQWDLSHHRIYDLSRQGVTWSWLYDDSARRPVG